MMGKMFLPLLAALIISLVPAQARKWNNTGVGSIIFEEAVSLPNLRPNP